MKSATAVLFLFLAACRLCLAEGGPAAKEALRILARDRGAAYNDRIIQVSGDRGMDQPAAWHIVAVDGSGVLREFLISRKGILREGPVPSQAIPLVNGVIIPMKQATVDSTIAFMKANEAAKKARIGYDSIIYRLRCRDQKGNPAWTLQLNNAAGQRLAEVTVSASTGKVIQFLAYPVPPPQAAAPQPPPAGEAWNRTKEAAGRATQSVGTGLRRTGEWISRKFSPN